jgi:hypothetical protein
VESAVRARSFLVPLEPKDGESIAMPPGVNRAVDIYSDQGLPIVNGPLAVEVEPEDARVIELR